MCTKFGWMAWCNESETCDVRLQWKWSAGEIEVVVPCGLLYIKLECTISIFCILYVVFHRQYSIGITTGVAFCGVVGHPLRHEYTGISYLPVALVGCTGVIFLCFLFVCVYLYCLLFDLDLYVFVYLVFFSICWYWCWSPLLFIVESFLQVQCYFFPTNTIKMLVKAFSVYSM